MATIFDVCVSSCCSIDVMSRQRGILRLPTNKANPAENPVIMFLADSVCAVCVFPNHQSVVLRCVECLTFYDYRRSRCGSADFLSRSTGVSSVVMATEVRLMPAIMTAIHDFLIHANTNLTFPNQCLCWGQFTR